MGKHVEYSAQTRVMQRLKQIREDHNLHAMDCSRIVEEATGYHFTTAMYDACEKGITKNVPLWAIIALLNSEEMGIFSADDVFPEVGAAWR